MRTQGLFGGVKAKQARAVSTYQAAWNAIASLAPNEEFGRWKDTLFELKNDDIRGPGHDKSECSESRYVQSWIWTTPQSRTSIEDLNPNDPNLHELLSGLSGARLKNEPNITRKRWSL